jgi:hypothetical protein
LPVEAVTTPRARWLTGIVRMRVTAPRTLNDPVTWVFSSFNHTSAPHDRLSPGE